MKLKPNMPRALRLLRCIRVIRKYCAHGPKCNSFPSVLFGGSSCRHDKFRWWRLRKRPRIPFCICCHLRPECSETHDVTVIVPSRYDNRLILGANRYVATNGVMLSLLPLPFSLLILFELFLFIHGYFPTKPQRCRQRNKLNNST